MSDDMPSPPPPSPPPPGPSLLYRLCEEMIALRELTTRQHKLFDQALARARDEMTQGFQTFAADTQRAYQQMRQELHGDRRLSVALLNELVEVSLDLERIVAARPVGGGPVALERWADGVAVEARKVQAALARHGVHPFTALPKQPYDPARHERVGGRSTCLIPGLIHEQVEPGYASAQPDFVLVRPKVIVTE